MATRYICPRCLLREGFLLRSSIPTKRLSPNPRKWNQHGTRLFGHSIHHAQVPTTEGATAQQRVDAQQKDTHDEARSVLHILEERGLVHDIAGTRKGLDSLLRRKKIGVYVGIDPTASSLHVGHLLPLMAQFWMNAHGYPTISLIGGFTAGVGDPSGRTTAREAQSSLSLHRNTHQMVAQLGQLWTSFKAYAANHGYSDNGHIPVMNNAEWGQQLTLEQFLREIGSGVRLGTMLSRDTVKSRMEKDGMSFAEFTYPLLQSYDFVHLYRNEGVQLQIGGSDQYGNIVAGVDAVKHYLEGPVESREEKKDTIDPLNVPYGFTVPLLTTASGAKFGKSAGNAIWLDPKKTSIFDLYGFMLSTADADVERYLKLFTLLSLDAITTAMQIQSHGPSARHAQHLLAHEFVSLVHGSEAATRARHQHTQLFGGRRKHSSSSSSDCASIPSNDSLQSESESKVGINIPSPLASLAPDLTLPRSSVLHQPLAHVLVLAKMASSRGEGQRLLESGGVYRGQQTVSGLDFEKKVGGRAEVVQEEDLVEGKMLVLRTGKKSVKVIQVVEDHGT